MKLSWLHCKKMKKRCTLDLVGISQTAVLYLQRSSHTDEFMICCDVCELWYHGACVGVDEEEGNEMEQYHCPDCESIHRKSSGDECGLPLCSYLVVQTRKKRVTKNKAR